VIVVLIGMLVCVLTILTLPPDNPAAFRVMSISFRPDHSIPIREDAGAVGWGWLRFVGAAPAWLGYASAIVGCRLQAI
jgi:hypothetical protein